MSSDRPYSDPMPTTTTHPTTPCAPIYTEQAFTDPMLPTDFAECYPSGQRRTTETARWNDAVIGAIIDVCRGWPMFVTTDSYTGHTSICYMVELSYNQGGGRAVTLEHRWIDEHGVAGSQRTRYPMMKIGMIMPVPAQANRYQDTSPAPTKWKVHAELHRRREAARIVAAS